METVVSGIRPTGNLHLGNYYGAVRSFVKMQDEFNCLFFIADWHSLTTSPKPEDIKRSARTIMAEYLACGLDPEKATIYLQSDVKEVLELYLFFNMNTYLGELERVTTFKDKARQQPDNVNAGLLTYPTLMAADILQHRAAKVPVGKDQEQNMEMARKCARRSTTSTELNISQSHRTTISEHRHLKYRDSTALERWARATETASISSTTRRQYARK